MSAPYVGNYTNNLYDPRKRYRLNTGGSAYIPGGFQKGKEVGDSELREFSDVYDSFVRQFVSNNFPRGSSTNNGFEVVQSSSPTNNFTITGGDGTVNGAGVLFADGYILFLKSNIEYTSQGSVTKTAGTFVIGEGYNIVSIGSTDFTAIGASANTTGIYFVATGAGSGTGTANWVTNDAYSASTFAALTTPGSPRTDVVFIDFFWSEVSATSGSEYLDSSLLIADLAESTANRVRQVQDIKVVEGVTLTTAGSFVYGTTYVIVSVGSTDFTLVGASTNLPGVYFTATGVGSGNGTALSGYPNADAYDSYGILHRRIPIAILNRSASSTISTAMITDIRFSLNPIHSFSDYTAVIKAANILLDDGAPLGDTSHRLGHLYMHGIIDYDTGLIFNDNGTERMILTPAGSVGIGITNPGSTLQVNGNAAIGYAGATSAAVNGLTVAGAFNADSDVTISGNVGIGTTTLNYPVEIIKDPYVGVIQKIQPATGTSSSILELTNAGGLIFVGVESSTPGQTVTGSAAYAGLISSWTPNAKLQFAANNTVVMTINQGSGLVTLNTNGMSLDTLGATGFPALSGTSQTGVVRIESGGNAVLDMGLDNTGLGAWLQSVDKADLSTNFPLLLNPNSGYVGIGTTSPQTLFHISSSAIQGMTFEKTGTLPLKASWYIGNDQFVTNRLGFAISDNIALATRLLINDLGSVIVPASAVIGYSSLTTIAPTNGMAVYGNVGIGTTDVGSLLQVNGNAAFGFTSSTVAPANGIAVAGGASIGYLSPYDAVSRGLAVYGRVGIGVTNPNNTLTIEDHSANHTVLQLISNGSQDFAEIICGASYSILNTGIESSTGGNLLTGSLPYAAVINQKKPQALQFGTNNTAVMTLTNTGNVGIGTTNALSTLVVNGGLAIGENNSVSSGLIIDDGLGSTFQVAPSGVPGNINVSGSNGLVLAAGGATIDVGNSGTGNVIISPSNSLQLFSQSLVINNNSTQWTWPSSDGPSNYVLATDGGGNLFFAATGGVSVAAGYFINGVNYVISFVGNTNFIALGAAANSVGVPFTANGTGNIGETGTANYSGSIETINGSLAPTQLILGDTANKLAVNDSGAGNSTHVVGWTGLTPGAVYYANAATTIAASPVFVLAITGGVGIGVTSNLAVGYSGPPPGLPTPANGLRVSGSAVFDTLVTPSPYGVALVKANALGNISKSNEITTNFVDFSSLSAPTGFSPINTQKVTYKITESICHLWYHFSGTASSNSLTFSLPYARSVANYISADLSFPSYVQMPVQAGTSISAGYFVLGQAYIITSVGNTDFVAIGAAANAIGIRFVATGVGAGTGLAELDFEPGLLMITGSTTATIYTNPAKMGWVISGYKYASGYLCYPVD
jgi:hypothetical protein